MRILYLNFDRGIPVLGDKGASVHVREFVRAAAALGHEVLLVCTRLGSGNAPPPVRIVELADDHDAASVERVKRELGVEARGPHAALVSRELTKLAYDQSIAARVQGVLDAHQFVPDFIYERHALFSSGGTEVAARLARPRILEVNAPLTEEQKRFRGLRLESLARRMEAVSFGSAAAIVAVSQAVRQYIEALEPEAAAQVHVLANGVDLAGFAGGEHQREPMRARIGVAADTPVIGFVGSFKAWHGTELLLDVYRDIAAARKVHLVAVGDGPRWEAFRSAVHAASWRDSVTLAGRVPHADVPGWTAACDVVVAPYQAAPQFYFSPLKVIEALACGRPVVAPRIGQLTELIEDGVTGLLYRPEDAADCGRALRTLLDDAPRRSAMGRAARQSVAGRGWEQIVRRVAGLAESARSEVAA